jgi:hypothetical protein
MSNPVMAVTVVLPIAVKRAFLGVDPMVATGAQAELSGWLLPIRARPCRISASGNATRQVRGSKGAVGTKPVPMAKILRS